MAALPQDVMTELKRTIADLEQRLQSSLVENTRLQNELGIARDRQNASADILSTIANASSNAERALYQIAETSVIMITAYGDPETKRKAIASGATDLLTKPIDFALLRGEFDARLAQAS
jgi:CheY-like chemotaxis protein